MFDAASLQRDLERAGLPHWYDKLHPTIDTRLSVRGHGDFVRWQAVLDALPRIAAQDVRLDGDLVTVCDPGLSGKERADLRRGLLDLRPWRKGPFEICGVRIDAEWRSDLKWRRLAGNIEPLPGRRVLDVGSGNGYYALRMRGAGAGLVIGIDPTLLFVMQFAAINRFARVDSVHVLPLRLAELPAPMSVFDTTFSMGVLYHQRRPERHLRELYDTLRPGGQLVLETLVLPGDRHDVLQPRSRYARMRNVWHLPTVPLLETWLSDSGFGAIRVVDVCRTTVAEQRSTEWMTFESLREALDPADQTRTIEGHPAPLRALVTCTVAAG